MPMRVKPIQGQEEALQQQARQLLLAGMLDAVERIRRRCDRPGADTADCIECKECPACDAVLRIYGMTFQ